MSLNIQKLFKLRPVVVAKSKLVTLNCTNPGLLMGVELETENARHSGEWYGEHLPDVWKIERDGSLRPRDEGFEFISLPLPHGQLLSELGAFYKTTAFDFRNYSDRCSIHVHTNVQDFTQDQLASLCMVYSVVEDVLFQYANHYKCPKPDGYHRDTNLYCIPWNQCRMNNRLVEKMFNDTGHSLARWQKYTALNLLPITTQGTVEWRHMHGSSDMEKITTWLNLIGGVMEYAAKTPLDSVIETIKSLNDTSAYRQFFEGVFKQDLPYNDIYQKPLSEGVINAKYSLFDWDRSKSVPQEPKKVVKDDPFARFEAVVNRDNPATAAAVEGLDALRRRVRDNANDVQIRAAEFAAEQARIMDNNQRWATAGAPRRRERVIGGLRPAPIRINPLHPIDVNIPPEGFDDFIDDHERNE